MCIVDTALPSEAEISDSFAISRPRYAKGRIYRATTAGPANGEPNAFNTEQRPGNTP